MTDPNIMIIAAGGAAALTLGADKSQFKTALALIVAIGAAFIAIVFSGGRP